MTYITGGKDLLTQNLITNNTYFGSFKKKKTHILVKRNDICTTTL